MTVLHFNTMKLERELRQTFPSLKIRLIVKDVVIDSLVPYDFTAVIMTIGQREYLITPISAIETEPDLFNVKIHVNLITKREDKP